MAKARGGPALVFQALVYPVTDYGWDTTSYRENAAGYMLTRDAMVGFWSYYLNTPEDGASPLASPLRAADLSGLPPAIVITAEFDPLRDEGEAYAAKMKGAGVPVEAIRYHGQIHGFYANPAIDDGLAAIDRVAAALKAALQPATSPMS